MLKERRGLFLLSSQVCNASHVVTPVQQGSKPVEYRRPYAYPHHYMLILHLGMLLDLVVDGIAKEGNETRDTDDSQRLN